MNRAFKGLSAFPLTPFHANSVDESVFIRLIDRLVSAEVDSIAVLGSTGSYAYLSYEERVNISRLAVRHAAEIPVIVGIGSLRTSDVLRLADAAQEAGAQGVLLAPMSYQKLTPDEVFALYETITRVLSVPLCVYDNPATTQFNFSDSLLKSIAGLPNIGSIKTSFVVPGIATTRDSMRMDIEHLRSLIPPSVTIGVAGDGLAAIGMDSGCDVWYSVIAGAFPDLGVAIARGFREGRGAEAYALHDRYAAVWELFRQYGSLRVIATMAELSQLVESPTLPAPVTALEGDERQRVATLLCALDALN
jgi:4-hydroxy-tetrahydrodipicolinate synthase